MTELLGPRRRDRVIHEFGDICTDPDCATCSIWQRDGETREGWMARLRAAYEAAPFQHEREGAA
jgi:hypothetical protein